MDRDDLIDLFSEFGPIVIRRMFSGYGIVVDGVNFAMSLRAGLIFRVDDLTAARYDAEGLGPFQYQTRNKTVVVKSYRHIPERLYDDPEELAVWAREAVGAAQRAKAGKVAKARKRKDKTSQSKPGAAAKAKTAGSASGKRTGATSKKVSSVRRPGSGRSANIQGRPRR
jgi:DNA transformation protein